jgi:hypothetical protein
MEMGKKNQIDGEVISYVFSVSGAFSGFSARGIFVLLLSAEVCVVARPVLYWAKRAGGKRMAEQPQWQPIERLTLIASHIDGMLESATEQYETLQLAKPKPFVLDDYTVGCVIQVFTTQQGDLGLFDEQLRRWEKGSLTTAQRQEVERLASQMLQLHEVISAILTLAGQLKERTIEKVLAKSDVELGLETLLSGWPTDLK